MAGRLARGWAMAQASFKVLRRHPRLAVLPVISGAIMLTVALPVLSSLMPQFGAWHDATAGIWDQLNEVSLSVTAVAVLFVVTVAVLYLNAALIHCALRAHAGEEPSLRAGLAAAARRLPQIAGWAVVVSTVGVALHVLETVLRNSLGILGSLIGGLFEFGWSVATFFVMPVLVVERIGPITAIRRSKALLQSKWGEALSGETRFGLIGVLFFLQALLIFFVGLALTRAYGPVGLAGLGPILIVLGVLYAIATAVVLQALNAIFQAGVYLYAASGRVPPSLDPALVEDAFHGKGWGQAPD